MRFYIVWLNNTTDCRDDEWLKIKADDKEQARRIAQNICYNNGCKRGRFAIGTVHTLAEMKQADPWVHAHEWGRKCANE